MNDFFSGYLVNSDVWLMNTRRISLISSFPRMIDQKAIPLLLFPGRACIKSDGDSHSDLRRSRRDRWSSSPWPRHRVGDCVESGTGYGFQVVLSTGASAEI